MLFIMLSMNLLLDLYLLDIFEKFLGLYLIYPIMLIGVLFFINAFLGIKFFKLIYNQEIQESVFIILIIVIVEMILESIFFYSFLV